MTGRIDFLPERYARARSARRRAVLRLLAATLGLAAASVLDRPVMDVLPRATRELAEARERQSVLARELHLVQEDARRREQLAARTRRWLALLRSRDAVRTLGSLEAARPVGLQFLETELGSLVHQTVRSEAVGGARLPQQEQVRTVQRVLRLEGLALDTVQVTDFACKLSADPLWSQVRIESLQRAPLSGEPRSKPPQEASIPSKGGTSLGRHLYRFRLQARVQEGDRDALGG